MMLYLDMEGSDKRWPNENYARELRKASPNPFLRASRSFL
jgi:hypothetical protein